MTSPSASPVAHAGLRAGADALESKHEGLLCKYEWRGAARLRYACGGGGVRQRDCVRGGAICHSKYIQWFVVHF